MSDPINPAHYNGTACATIGERLSANSYQVLKYNWRLGKKDDPVVEVGKSIWYLDREITLGRIDGPPTLVLPDDEFFAMSLKGVDPHVFFVAHALISWCRYGDIETLDQLRKDLIEKRAELEEAASGQGTMKL